MFHSSLSVSEIQQKITALPPMNASSLMTEKMICGDIHGHKFRLGYFHNSISPRVFFQGRVTEKSTHTLVVGHFGFPFQIVLILFAIILGVELLIGTDSKIFLLSLFALIVLYFSQIIMLSCKSKSNEGILKFIVCELEAKEL